MPRNRTKDMTEGSPLKLIFTFAAPLLFGFLFQQLYSFVDTAIVGKYLGAAKLAAVGDTGSINFLILGFCQGCCSGFAIPVAQAFGARDEASLRRSITGSIRLCILLSLVMASATALACPAMLRLMNTPEEIIADSISYIRIIFMGIPVTILYNMASGILRSLGDSRTPVLFLIMASLINIVLDFVLILVFHLDVAGAAIATVVSQLCSGIGCLLVMRRNFPILRLSRGDWNTSPHELRRLASIGLPMGLQYSITAVGSVIVQWSVNGIGVNAVAAIAAGVKISVFFCCFFDAVATTMATFAGQNMGARKISRIHRGLMSSALIGIIYCLLALLVIFLGGRTLLGLFVDPQRDPEVLDMAFHFLRVNAAFYIPLLFVNIVRFSIQGMGYTRIAMVAGVFEMVARTMVALFLVPVLRFDGAVLANPAAWILANLFLFPCYFHVLHMVRQRLHEPRQPKEEPAC